ncbi:GSCOCG00011260001-RA-CDS, partial [Cotesia congregata]
MSKAVKVRKDNLITLVNFCFDSSYFTFQNEIYQQLEGSSMGNPASPSLANIVMNYVINKAVDILNFNIPLLKLYVDDTLLLIPKDKVDEVFRCFNSINDKIKFTMEVEIEGRLPFLNLVVIREEERLITDWYVKETSNGRLLNFRSNHPSSQKLGMINELLHRAINLSNEKFAEKNLARV